MVKPEPLNPRWVAEWSARRAFDSGGEGLALWIRRVPFGQPSWELTSGPLTAPKMGTGWRLTAWIEWDHAARALGETTSRHESRYLAHARLVDVISEALAAAV